MKYTTLAISLLLASAPGALGQGAFGESPFWDNLGGQLKPGQAQAYHAAEKVGVAVAKPLSHGHVRWGSLNDGIKSHQGKSLYLWNPLRGRKLLQSDFEKKVCQEFPSDKACVKIVFYCLDHFHKYEEQCADNVKEFCVRDNNSGDQRCHHFLKKFCPDHADNGACAEFCDEHPHKCGGGKQPHDQCIFNGSGRSSRGALGATTRSTSDQPVEVSGPSHDDIQEAFQSLQEEEQPETMLGATRGPPPPPGQLPIDDLKPLLEKLGVTLGRSDLRTVKKQLDQNRTGYFSLTSFFFWWSTYMVCTSILG